MKCLHNYEDAIYGVMIFIITGSQWWSLVPILCQAITLTSVYLSSTEQLRTDFDGIFLSQFSFFLKKIHLKMLSAKCQLFCPGRNMLMKLS